MKAAFGAHQLGELDRNDVMHACPGHGLSEVIPGTRILRSSLCPHCNADGLMTELQLDLYVQRVNREVTEAARDGR
jgi:DnaJ-class molecular chaperone